MQKREVSGKGRYEADVADIGLFGLFPSIVLTGNPNEYSVCEMRSSGKSGRRVKQAAPF